MEAPEPTSGSRSRILGHSSMIRFLRGLVGSRGGPRRSDRGLAGGLVRWESGLLALLPFAFSMAVPRRVSRLSQHEAWGVGKGNVGTRTPSAKEALRLTAQGVAVTSVLPRGSPEVLGHPPEMEKGEDEGAAGEVLGDSGAADRDGFAQALAMEPRGPLSPAAFTRKEEEEVRLLEGDLQLASSKMGETPWNHLLSLYKQLQKSIMAKEDLPHDKPGEDEEMEEEDSSFKLCVPGVVPFQSPLHKTFRSTDTVGFVESELKKLLAVQRESRLWKMGSLEGRELLAQPEATLEEASMEDGQEGGGSGLAELHQLGHGEEGPGKNLLFEEMDEMGNWPPE